MPPGNPPRHGPRGCSPLVLVVVLALALVGGALLNSAAGAGNGQNTDTLGGTP